MSSPLKVYPTAVELSKITNTLYCPEDGCGCVFTSGSNLNLHLAKTHKKTQLLQTDNNKKEYHCPDIDCTYHNKSFFKNLKLLKQHFLKVHCEKSYNCENCTKGFSTESSKKAHVEYCGVVFKCCDCSASYESFESLKTHGRRKKHDILEKVAYKMNSASVTIIDGSTETLIAKGRPLLLPKLSQDVTVFVAALEIKKETNVMHKAMQTEDLTKLSVKLPSCDKKIQVCVETQTVGDYIAKKLLTEGVGPDDNLNKRSARTQTEIVDSKTQSSNTSFSLTDFDFNAETIERNSSSTQTLTEKDLALNDFDTNFFNCNSETQTDFMFQDEMFNVCDYYSHMYTQTCEDILLDGLGFNDNHTQTVFDDIVRNVESQTMMFYNKRNLLGCKDMASMQTQTDVEFKQMLEEINA